MGTAKGIARADLIREYVEKPGASVAAACRALGVCRATFKKALARHEFVVLPERQFGHRMTDFPQLRDRGWLEAQLQTRTMQSIARELGTSSGNVSDHVRRHGLRWPDYDRTEAIKAGLQKAGIRTGASAANWRGGRVKTASGHIYVQQPSHPYCNKNGYVMEHRLMMEQHIGRLLTKSEVVHHRNGFKADNRLENLQLMTAVEHRAFHLTADKRLFAAEARIALLETFIRDHGLQVP